MKNPKFEKRNPKQTQNSKFKWPEFVLNLYVYPLIYKKDNDADIV